MIVYRLTKSIYSHDLSGYGASLSATNRWNSKGVPLLYTAANRSLAFAEVFAHLPLHLIPENFVMVTIELPKTATITTLNLKKDIREHRLAETQELGEAFATSAFQLAMRVPSYVVPGEFNVLINSSHAAMNHVSIVEVTPFPFDVRLFKR
jgi:RES domain-containing protein